MNNSKWVITKNNKHSALEQKLDLELLYKAIVSKPEFADIFNEINVNNESPI